MGTHGNYDQLQGLVNALQCKLNADRGHAILAKLAEERKSVYPAPVAAVADAPPEQGVCDTQVEEDEDQEEEAEAEEVARVEEEVASSRASDASTLKMQELAPQKPVATPARASASIPTLEILKRLHESRKAASEETGPALAALPAPAVLETAPSPSSSEPVINSSTHKREYMRLAPWLVFRLLAPPMKFVCLGSGAQLMCCLAKKRIENAGTLATTYPSMHALAQGSNKDSHKASCIVSFATLTCWLAFQEVFVCRTRLSS